MVDHRHIQLVLRPDDGVWVCALARKEQIFQRRGVIFGQQFSLRVCPLDRPERCRRGEQHLDLVILDHPPENPGIRGANRLALEQHSGTAHNQWRIDDIGMADNPAYVRCRPVNLARLCVIDIGHRPAKRDGMSTIVAHHPLGLAGCPGCIENIERVCCLDRYRCQRLCPFMCRIPLQITSGDQISLQGRALVNHTGLRLVAGQFDCLIQQRLVGDDPPRLMAAGCADNGLWLCVINPLGQFGSGEATKHDRMHRTEARTAQHGDKRLGDHRHIDDYPVTLVDPKPRQHASKQRRRCLQLGKTHGRGAVSDWRIIDDRLLVTAAGSNMPVDGIVAGIQLAIREPSAEGRVGRVQRTGWRCHPVYGFGRVEPEPFTVRLRLLIEITICRHCISFVRTPSWVPGACLPGTGPRI